MQGEFLCGQFGCDDIVLDQKAAIAAAHDEPLVRPNLDDYAPTLSGIPHRVDGAHLIDQDDPVEKKAIGWEIGTRVNTDATVDLGPRRFQSM